jgi:hypothetical protein
MIVMPRPPRRTSDSSECGRDTGVWSGLRSPGSESPSLPKAVRKSPASAHNSKAYGLGRCRQPHRKLLTGRDGLDSIGIILADRPFSGPTTPTQSGILSSPHMLISTVAMTDSPDGVLAQARQPDECPSRTLLWLM